ncbi:hypothetical protein L2E82_30298 [Cichorium intybus]|uniref:Uncharacterized protein n=1 Tax=Cichorium intybus TaxID=13427 RepID=A0ACB9D0K1_CICIN|nr:hypothetical protein L2E82_30298 [Cichorium intybus]
METVDEVVEVSLKSKTFKIHVKENSEKIFETKEMEEEGSNGGRSEASWPEEEESLCSSEEDCSEEEDEESYGDPIIHDSSPEVDNNNERREKIINITNNLHWEKRENIQLSDKKEENEETILEHASSKRESDMGQSIGRPVRSPMPINPVIEGFTSPRMMENNGPKMVEEANEVGPDGDILIETQDNQKEKEEPKLKSEKDIKTNDIGDGPLSPIISGINIRS